MSELSENPKLVAEREGLVCVEPEKNELFLDIDNPVDLEHFTAMEAVLENNGFFLKHIKTTVSKGGNKHVYLRVLSVDELTDIQRIALQACLGSDRKRELLSMLRVFFETDRRPTVFFEKRTS